MTAVKRWIVMHDKKPQVEGAPEPCGKIAFYSLVQITGGMLMRAQDFVMPDGSVPVSRVPIICGSCGYLLDMRFAGSTLTVIPEVLH